MNHNIRQRVINSIGLPVVKIEHVQGELGSGMFDRKGVEIFEGDIVQVSKGKETFKERVKFSAGAFIMDIYDLCDFESFELEVIGHAED